MSAPVEAVRFIGQMLITLHMKEDGKRVVIDTSRIVYFWEMDEHTVIRINTGSDPGVSINVVESIETVIELLESAY